MLKFFSSLRTRILLLIAIPFAVTFGLTIYHTLDEREEHLADARKQIIGTARLMAAEQQRIIERAHQILLSVALLPELRRGITPEVCSRALSQKVKEGGVFVNMLVALPNGDAICNAIGITRPINIADRDFFQRALQTHEFEVGGYIISRSTGKPAIGIAYPLLDAAGRPEAVVSATLDLGWLEKELAKFELPEGSHAVVLGQEGTVLAHHPDPEGWTGKPVPADMPLVRTVLSNGGEGTADELGLDGVRRIFAFTPLHQATTAPVYLLVGIPKDAVVGPEEREFVWSVVIALSLLVLTFGVFWLGSERLFLRRIAALGNAATALGKGDRTARTGLLFGDDEIAQLAQSFDQMAGTLETNEKQLIRTNRALRTLSACNEALVHARNESELLNSICRLIVETGGYRMAWVGFPEQDPAKTVRAVAQSGHDEGYLEAAKISWADTERGRGPTGMAIRTGTVQVNQNLLTNPQSSPWWEASQLRGYQSSIALPLRNASGTFGALSIYAPEPDAFNEDEVKLLQELAEDLAFGIETLRTRADRDRIAYEHQHHAEVLRQSLVDSIKAIADTVEMRDPYTAGHQRRVGELAVALSRELGLPEETIRGIELAASIHDLGKIKVPAEILVKPTKLTDVEFMLIKMHPQSGYDILKDIKFPWPIATMVWQHHERLDGSGYPQGLKDGEILMESRIIAVADVIEAMASHRPYRASLGIDVALKEIERGRDTAYDPAVVDGCLKLFREQGFSFRKT